jgi:hypothetical protein
MKAPDAHQVCSKRSWDGQVRRWRRLLHLFDPPEMTSATSTKSLPNTPYSPRTISEMIDDYLDEEDEDQDEDRITYHTPIKSSTRPLTVPATL